MIMIDTETCQVLWKGQDVRLTQCEFNTVAALAAKPGKFVSYRQLYDAYKGLPGFMAGEGHDGYKGNIRSAIKRIRIKFRLIDPAFNAVINYTGFGYGWVEPKLLPSCCPTCGQPLPEPTCERTYKVPRVRVGA